MHPITGFDIEERLIKEYDGDFTNITREGEDKRYKAETNKRAMEML